MRARLLGRHLNGLLVFEEGAVVVFHALHHFAGNFVDPNRIGIQPIEFRKRLLRQLHVHLAEQVPDFLIFRLTL